jgi:hypothetical protein
MVRQGTSRSLWELLRLSFGPDNIQATRYSESIANRRYGAVGAPLATAT